MGISSSYHNSVDNPFVDECSSYSLEIIDESALDGEVGKRLNQIVPVPVSIYVPFVPNTSVDSVIQYYIVLGQDQFMHSFGARSCL